ncbi:MAG TPA: hypothetical protein VFM90_08350 [Cyclobacteriaceae bacterium]|nr:hypothetical protein [Cyclobacteriaceae bacterium]
MESLYQTSNISISLDSKTNTLICTWIGPQNEEALRQAGAKIKELFIAHNCTKILNDNTQVVGEWNHSTQWARNEWFPQMIRLGLKKFAWVLALDTVAQISAYWVSPGIHIVKTFISTEDAFKWLVED